MHITVEEIIENEKEDLVTVILDMDEEAKTMLMEAGFNSILMETCKKAKWDCWKPDCIIWDIDGTHSLKRNRGTFDYSKVGEDDRNNDIANLHTLLEPEIDVIVCTGREGTNICKQETFYWLKVIGLNYKRIHFRKTGDMRKDFIVKAEMWREIQKEFNIIAIFDDRKQVVNFAKKLGYTVCQVADENF
jgi:hypothetical protein